MNANLLSICGVFGGCGSNVIFLELLTKSIPGSGNLITFAQFAFIAIEEFIFERKFCTKSRHISYKYYAILVLMFFSFSVINNYALKFNIPMPLHIIVRSGSLVANMLMGAIILGKRYNLYKILATLMITVGIILFTIASAFNLSNNLKSVNDFESFDNSAILFIGISLLIIALLLSALTGLFQEKLYKKFGRHTSREALFYTHALSMPAFLLTYPDLIIQIKKYNASNPLFLWNSHSVPVLWLYLLGNVLTQFICIRSVFWLTSTYSSLTVTLILTLRKFVSLFVSIIYFKTPISTLHILGATLVFVGTLIFYEIFSCTNSNCLKNCYILIQYYLHGSSQNSNEIGSESLDTNQKLMSGYNDDNNDIINISDKPKDPEKALNFDIDKKLQ